MKDNSPGTIAPVLIIVGAVIAGLILVCGVLLVVFLFFGVSGIASSPAPIVEAPPTVSDVETGPDVQPLVTPTPTGGSDPEAEAPTEEPETSSPSQSVDSDTSAAMLAVEAVVADLRELESLAEVPKAYLNSEDLREIVVNDFFEDYSEEEAADDAIFYAALDVVDVDFDLYQFYIDLYSEGIAGYYDPEKDEFFLISESGTFTASDEWTFAHEYVHALQDQHFDLEQFLHYDDDDWYVENFDEGQARSALIEGDASLSSLIYIGQGMSPERQEALLEEYEDTEIPEIYERTPYFILEDFFFPYTQGQEFVDFLHNRGGFDLVDRAYEEPPLSTEHILHPEKYIDYEEPLAVTLEDTLAVLGGDYREVYTLPMGEWYIQLYLSQLLDAEPSGVAADGWGGDRMGLYVNDATGELVMVLRVQWDTPVDAAEFATIYPVYAEQWSLSGSSAFEDDGLTCWAADDFLCLIQIASDETMVIRGPDADIVSAIAEDYR